MAGAFSSNGSFAGGGGVRATNAGRVAGGRLTVVAGGVRGASFGAGRLLATGGVSWVAGGSATGRWLEGGVCASLVLPGGGLGRATSPGRTFCGGIFFAVLGSCPGWTFAAAGCSTIAGRCADTGGRVGLVPATMAFGVGLICGCGITCARASCCGLTRTRLRETGSALRNVLAETAVIATV